MKNIKLYLNNAGYCLAKGNHVIKGGKREQVKFPALFGLLHHPEKGWILYDTGYTDRFYNATKSFPNKIYAKLTLVEIKPEEEIKAQIEQIGLHPDDIKHIILTHFHADHIGGLKDFKNASIYCSKKAYKHTMSLGAFFAFSKGVLKDLIPDDIGERVHFIEDIAKQVNDEIFGVRYDLFNDDSIYVYNLPGHATGQVGILVQTNKHQYFLIADACWTYRAYKKLKFPNQIVRVFFSSWRDYQASIFKIRAFNFQNPEVIIVPTHCTETTEQLIAKKIDLDVL